MSSAEGPAGTTGDPANELGLALRDFANAVRALQLYPSSSPVVSEAVERAHSKLTPLLQSSQLSLDVLPDTIRVHDVDMASGSRSIASLAERLHQRGVAHLYLDGALQPSSLKGLAVMLAEDPDKLNDQGGVASLCTQQELGGINIEMLQLEKLYEEEEEAESDPDAEVWEKILGNYSDELDLSSIDWESLASEPDELEHFLEWLLDEDSPPPGISEMSRLQVVRAVCERVGQEAAELGPDRVDGVAEVFSKFYDKLDKEVWVDLLGQPLEVGSSGSVRADATATGEHDAASDALRDAVTDLGSADLAHSIGASLNGEQVEDLLVYALTSRQEASPRIFGLFQGLLEARSERDVMKQSIRETIEEQTSGIERETFEELWPHLNEALQGEDIAPYVSTTYQAQLDHLLADAPPSTLWDVERIAPRYRELHPGYLVQRKAKIILEILAAEPDDEGYVELVGELERALPELIVDGQYIATEEILATLATDLMPATGRSDAKREAARDVLIRFCNEHTLREVVRNLAGKRGTQIDAATRIFSSLGPMAVPALLEALSHEQSRPIRVHLVRMLAAIGDQSLPEIRKHLRDKRWFFVRNLVWIIGEIGDPGFVPHLGIIMKHPDVRVRRETVRSMAKLRNEATMNVLLDAIDDTDEEVQLLSIRGLGTSGASPATPRLRQLLALPNGNGNNTEIIRAAAIALGRLGATEATGDLKKVAARPWLFRSRRIAASVAASWALATLHGEATGDAPEAELAPSRDDAPGDRD